MPQSRGERISAFLSFVIRSVLHKNHMKLLKFISTSHSQNRPAFFRRPQSIWSKWFTHSPAGKLHRSRSYFKKPLPTAINSSRTTRQWRMEK
jgi:hypothetical protein